MGMSASQSRSLFLTARIADLELRAQQLTNAKVRLGSQQTAASDKYLEALNTTWQDYVLKDTTSLGGDYSAHTNVEDLTESQMDALLYGTVDATGTFTAGAMAKYAPTGYTSPTGGTYTDEEKAYIRSAFEHALKNLSIEDSIAAGTDTFQEEGIKARDLAVNIASTEYTKKMTEIEAIEKVYDMEIKNIETEHKAVQTEMDSVSKVIEKNIDRTFKIFG